MTIQYWAERLSRCDYTNTTGPGNALLSTSATWGAGMCTCSPSPSPASWSPRAGTPARWVAGGHAAPQGFAAGQPRSYSEARRGGLKQFHPLLQCHPGCTKVFCGVSSFELESGIVTNENCFANIMDVKECKFYQYYRYFKMPVLPIQWIF